VLSLVAGGATNADIADELFISLNTVKRHVRDILRKLHMSSRVEAAIYAHRKNLL
jgi:two-component system NarL family response regulator